MRSTVSALAVEAGAAATAEAGAVCCAREIKVGTAKTSNKLARTKTPPPTKLRMSPPQSRPEFSLRASLSVGAQHAAPLARRRFHGIPSIRNFRLRSGEIQQHHIRALLPSFENNFTSIRRNVEVLNVEIGSELGQLPLGARLQLDEPQILMSNLSSQQH